MARWHINHSFYVDDLLGGSNTVEEALGLFSELTEILTKGGFTLRKFRSSTAEVLSKIPDELVEPMPSKDLVDMHSTSYPNALGILTKIPCQLMSSCLTVSPPPKGASLRCRKDI